MDQITANFLTGLAVNLTSQVIQYAAPKLKRQILGTAKEQAIQRCLYAGIVAILGNVHAATPKALTQLVEEIFTRFFNQEDVQYEIAEILKGHQLNQTELLHRFEDAGYDPETLPGIQPTTAFSLFESAFIAAAMQEPELQPVIQAGYIVKLTKINQDLLAAVQEILAFLQKAHQETLAIQNGQLISRERVSGQTIIYQLPVMSGELAVTDWESHYLKTLCTRCDELDISIFDPTQVTTETGTAEHPLRISDVFTTLYLKDRHRAQDQPVADALLKPPGATREAEMRTALKEEERIPIQAIEAVAATQRLVILGQPGAGKSTLVNHLTTQLARRCAGWPVKPDHLPGWDSQEKPMPLRIILRRLAAWLPEQAPPDKAGLIWDYVKDHLKNLGCEECFLSLKARLKDDGGIIFFDGLDEVSETDEAAKRSLIKTAIQEFTAPLDKCRVVLTCREYAYRAGDAWRLPEAIFPVVELSLFKLDQIKQFTHTWYQVTGPRKGWEAEKCRREADQLSLAIQEWPHLFELAQYPLLLTLMSQVHGRYGYLPKDRADLYYRTVELMLAHWENRIARDLMGSERRVEDDLIYRLNIRTDTLLAALQKVAFQAHERQEKEKERGEQAADIRKEELREVLGQALGSYDQAELVIQYTQERAGLLQARDNFTYAFPHRTFQEYLAAGYLLKQADFDKMLTERVKRDLNWWREVFLLAAGSSKEMPRNIIDLIDTLLLPKVTEIPVTAEKMNHAILAGQALYETEFAKQVASEQATESGRYTATYQRIKDWLESGLTAAALLKPTERAEAGNKLAQLGDPRPEVITLEAMQFCYIPAGAFWMGSPDDDKLSWSEAEKPIHKLEITYAFWISRFPITNAQFKEFVNDSDGYTSVHWWTRDGLINRGDRQKPKTFGGILGLPNHPVVRINWYEALAFTRWLTDRLRKNGLISGKMNCQLPSEAEWEKAARGGEKIPNECCIQALNQLNFQPKVTLVDNPAEKRRFPWGNEIDANRLNFDETGIKSTNTPGIFLGGQSVYGCEEMSGPRVSWRRIRQR